MEVVIDDKNLIPWISDHSAAISYSAFRQNPLGHAYWGFSKPEKCPRGHQHDLSRPFMSLRNVFPAGKQYMHEPLHGDRQV